MRLTRNGRLFVLLALSIAVLAGCGRSEPRGQISGGVQFNGKPVEEGMVSFESIDTAGPPRNLLIKSGTYRSDEKLAVKPGKYRVRINAADTSKKNTLCLDDPYRKPPNFVQLLPTTWNVQSKMEVEIKVGMNTINFSGNKGESPRVEVVAQ
jgi:hypothetical protein